MGEYDGKKMCCVILAKIWIVIMVWLLKSQAYETGFQLYVALFNSSDKV